MRDRIDWRPETTVWALEDGCAHMAGPRGGTVLHFDRVILATGVNDGIVPIKGWTLPGVHGLATADRQLKVTGKPIGKRIAFVGSGPLLAPIASQHHRAGAHAAAIIDAAPRSSQIAACAALARHPRDLASFIQDRAALALNDIPVHPGALPVAILGDERVEAISFRRADGKMAEVRCDAVALGFGLRLEVDLAAGIGAQLYFDESCRQWLPRTDGAGRVDGQPGVYAALPPLDLAGAEAAGRRAALAVLADLGDSNAHHALARIMRRAHGTSPAQPAHAAPRAYPAAAAPSALSETADDDTILCRCTGVTVGAFRKATGKGRIGDLERIARLTSLGFGGCQGRMCATAAAEILAAEARTTVAQVGRLPRGLPAAPVTIATASSAGPTAGPETTTHDAGGEQVR